MTKRKTKKAPKTMDDAWRIIRNLSLPYDEGLPLLSEAADIETRERRSYWASKPNAHLYVPGPSAPNRRSE